ncbi:MAG: type II toxin-antitoxin system HicB family antitoxin [Candidatus Omnitrophica bacterium]|nr:type II toxin-antitoxin system HicB family antitoxin [Candidatus Omnitrophota bacterium]
MKYLKNKISTEEFDRNFDQGKDVGVHLDRSKAKVNKKVHRINIDFPELFIRQIDREAQKIGVARTALIKMWVAERLETMRQG